MAILVKALSKPFALIALVGLVFQSFWISLMALSMFAIQSSFFGPAKFGIIPGLVANSQLSKANGLLNAFTNIAIILGSLAAGFLTDLYYPTMKNPKAGVVALVAIPQAADAARPIEKEEVPKLIPDPARKPQRLPMGLALVGVSLLGLIAVLMMPRAPAVDPDLSLSFDILGSHIQTLSVASRPLLVVLFSWSGFYLIGSLALMLLPEYQGILGLQPLQITRLLALLAISVAAGSFTVGFLSGKTVRPYFSLAGAVGMTTSFAVMGLSPLNYAGLAALVCAIGFSAGFYIVPLQALLQTLAPSEERGRFFGTANALSFTFMAMAALFFISLSRAGISPARIPLFCAGLAGVGTLVGMIELNRIMRAQKSLSISTDSHREERPG